MVDPREDMCVCGHTRVDHIRGECPGSADFFMACSSPLVKLFADTPVVCEPYDNGFDPQLFAWEDPCL